MKLLVGLGNPGEKYKNNRHNVGFMFIDYIKKNIGNEKKKQFVEKKMLHVTCYMLHQLILAKPLTFMNLSGSAVEELIGNWKLEIGNLIVVHDDLDIPLGKFKIQKGVGPLLHNGLESIEKAIGTIDFWRVRIGVDNRKQESWIDGEAYVLQNFLPDKMKMISSIFPQIFERLKTQFLPGS